MKIYGVTVCEFVIRKMFSIHSLSRDSGEITSALVRLLNSRMAAASNSKEQSSNMNNAHTMRLNKGSTDEENERKKISASASKSTKHGTITTAATIIKKISVIGRKFTVDEEKKTLHTYERTQQSEKKTTENCT